jgi:[ribosomal protein S18]-alanine N-acetyltransferase
VQKSNINSLIIRNIIKQDLDQILSIDTQVARDPWTEKIFSDCISMYNGIVAVIDQKIVGYGIIAIYNSISEAHVLNLAVDPLWQRQGIASKLLDNLINYNNANNKKTVIFLESSKNNIAAINLYKKFNFTESYIRKNYYNTKYGKEDAIVFKRDF